MLTSWWLRTYRLGMLVCHCALYVIYFVIVCVFLTCWNGMQWWFLTAALRHCLIHICSVLAEQRFDFCSSSFFTCSSRVGSSSPFCRRRSSVGFSSLLCSRVASSFLVLDCLLVLECVLAHHMDMLEWSWGLWWWGGPRTYFRGFCFGIS